MNKKIAAVIAALILLLTSQLAGTAAAAVAPGGGADYIKKRFDVKICFTFNGKTFIYDSFKERAGRRNDGGNGEDGKNEERGENGENGADVGEKGSRDELLGLIGRVLRLGFSKETALNYALDGLSGHIAAIKKEIEYPARDACLIFKPSAKENAALQDSQAKGMSKLQDSQAKGTSNGSLNGGVFGYTPEAEGRAVDGETLYSLLYMKLMREAEISLAIPVKSVKPTVTVGSLKARTALRGGFSSYCTASGENRKDNIRLAVNALNGAVIPAGEILSFNKTVGERTEARGFKVSKVILDGVYVDGVGGGACQVSSTLYNAALAAGLEIVEWHRHTLKSTYVAPSFDAMVSGRADLKIRNDTAFPLYVTASLTDDKISVRFYGLTNPYLIKRVSVTLSRTKADIERLPDEEGKFSDELAEEGEFLFRRPVDGLTSEGFLEYYQNDRLIKRKKIRSDVYRKQNGIVYFSPR